MLGSIRLELRPQEQRNCRTITLLLNTPIVYFSYNGQLILNPALAENRVYICNVVNDIVRRYDVDGLHIDDYFYPYPAAGFTIDGCREFRTEQQWQLPIKVIGEEIMLISLSNNCLTPFIVQSHG